MKKDITDLTMEAQERSVHLGNVAEVGIEAIHCAPANERTDLTEQVLAILEAVKLFSQEISNLIDGIEASDVDRKQVLA